MGNSRLWPVSGTAGHLLFSLLTIVALAPVFSSAAHATVIISTERESNLGLSARDSVGDQVSADVNGVVLPLTTSRTATTAGGTVGTAVYDFSVTGDSASFSFEFDFFRSGVIDSNTGAAGDVHFTVSVPSIFNIDGSIILTGDGRLLYLIAIRDLTVSGGAEGFVYDSRQLSLNTTDQEFVVGGLDGDATPLFNSLVGSLPGTLIPGHLYDIDYNIGIATPADGDGGASATGGFTVNIRPGSVPVPVPEPSTLALFATGLAGLGFLMRRRRRSMQLQAA